LPRKRIQRSLQSHVGGHSHRQMIARPCCPPLKPANRALSKVAGGISLRRKTIERPCIQRHVGAYSGQQILGAYRPPLLERAALLQKPHRFQSQSDPRPVHWALRKVTAGGTFMPARAIQRGAHSAPSTRGAHLRIRFSELLAASAPSRQRPCGDSSGTISMKPCTRSQELGSRLRPQAMKGVLRWCGAMRQQREATGFDILQRTSGLVSSASEPGRTRLVCQWTRTLSDTVLCASTFGHQATIRRGRSSPRACTIVRPSAAARPWRVVLRTGSQCAPPSQWRSPLNESHLRASGRSLAQLCDTEAALT
jgi:hypothetical protein